MYRSATLLHPEYFRTPFGEGPRNDLQDGITRFAADISDSTVTTPDISVVIQSVGDTPEQLGCLFGDLENQDYPAGVQPIVVHGGNISKASADVAKAHNATLRRVDLFAPDFRAGLLNEGVRAADNKFIFTTVGHAALSSNMVLRAAAHHAVQEEVGGVFGVVLPDRGASLTERTGAQVLGAADILQRKQPMLMERGGLGMLAADCSMVNRDIIQELGGYPSEFGMGGADGNLGEKMLAEKYLVVQEAVLAVHHTHDFGPIKAMRQFLAWQRMAKPGKYAPRRWTWHPNGGL